MSMTIYKYPPTRSRSFFLQHAFPFMNYKYPVSQVCKFNFHIFLKLQVEQHKSKIILPSGRNWPLRTRITYFLVRKKVIQEILTSLSSVKVNTESYLFLSTFGLLLPMGHGIFLIHQIYSTTLSSIK